MVASQEPPMVQSDVCGPEQNIPIGQSVSVAQFIIAPVVSTHSTLQVPSQRTRQAPLPPQLLPHALRVGASTQPPLAGSQVSHVKQDTSAHRFGVFVGVSVAVSVGVSVADG